MKKAGRHRRESGSFRSGAFRHGPDRRRHFTYRKMSGLLGWVGALGTIVLWTTFDTVNPYVDRFEPGAFVRTFVMVFLPACLAAAAAYASSRTLMAAAFIWGLPAGLYLSMTPGIFALIGLTTMLYLASFLLMDSE